MIEMFGFFWHPTLVYVVVMLFILFAAGFIASVIENGGRNGR